MKYEIGHLILQFFLFFLFNNYYYSYFILFFIFCRNRATAPMDSSDSSKRLLIGAADCFTVPETDDEDEEDESMIGPSQSAFGSVGVISKHSRDRYSGGSELSVINSPASESGKLRKKDRDLKSSSLSQCYVTDRFDVSSPMVGGSKQYDFGKKIRRISSESEDNSEQEDRKDLPSVSFKTYRDKVNKITSDSDDELQSTGVSDKSDSSVIDSSRSHQGSRSIIKGTTSFYDALTSDSLLISPGGVEKNPLVSSRDVSHVKNMISSTPTASTCKKKSFADLSLELTSVKSKPEANEDSFPSHNLKVCESVSGSSSLKTNSKNADESVTSVISDSSNSNESILECTAGPSSENSMTVSDAEESVLASKSRRMGKNVIVSDGEDNSGFTKNVIDLSSGDSSPEIKQKKKSPMHSFDEQNRSSSNLCESIPEKKSTSNSSKLYFDASKYSFNQLKALLRQKETQLRADQSINLKKEVEMIRMALSQQAKEQEVQNVSSSEESSSESSSEEEPSSPHAPSTEFVPKAVYRYEPPPSPEKEEESGPAQQIKNLEKQIRIKRNIYQASNLRSMEDGGSKLQKEITQLEKELMMVKLRAQTDAVMKGSSTSEYHQKPLGSFNLNLGAKASSSNGKDTKYETPQIPQHVIDALYAADKNYGARDYGGKLSHNREREMVRVTGNVLEGFEAVLKSMPDVESIDPSTIEEPNGLRVNLMNHQKQALSWMLWRESQDPPGGILADDMGLGKTLTMLSLILRHKQLVDDGTIEDFAMKQLRDDEREEDDKENKAHGWLARSGLGKLKKSRGTLIICPASLIGQWEGEIKRRFVMASCLHWCIMEATEILV